MRNAFKIFVLFVICACLFSCSKESIRRIETLSGDISSIKGVKNGKQTASRPTSEIGYLSVIESNGSSYTYAISLLRNGPPRVLKGWKLLTVPSGLFVASGSLDIRESTNTPSKIYLGTVNNLATGSYEIQVSYSETFVGSGWWPTPGGVIYSDESYVQAYATGALINVYRYYNGVKHDHFYSRIKSTYIGYGYEGVFFTAYSPGLNNGTIPMYRYYNGVGVDHFYTIKAAAYPGYTYEGIEFNVGSTASSGGTPLYRYYNSDWNDHFYTKTYGSYSGYGYEGIEGYVW